jgi:hypothetical protein
MADENRGHLEVFPNGGCRLRIECFLIDRFQYNLLFSQFKNEYRKTSFILYVNSWIYMQINLLFENSYVILFA